MADKRNLLLICIFAGFILFKYVSAALIGKLQNTEAVVGSRVEIFCTTSEPYSINWEHTSVGDRYPNDVYHGSSIIYPYDEQLKVKVNKLTGEYRLIFPSVQKEDAGRYECIDEAGQGERQTAELVVLESTPQCQKNFNHNGILIENDCGLDPDSIEFRCDLHYTGNKEPELRWYHIGGNEVIPRRTTTRSLPGHSFVSVSIKPTLQEDGGSYTCRTSWSTINWTSPTLKLLYAFNDSSIQQISEPIQLSCTVNSSQHCTYYWIHNDELLTEHRVVEISNPGLYICIARCPIRRHECVVTAKMVEFVTGDSDATQTIWIMVGATTGATISFIIVVVNWIIQRVRKRISRTEIGRSNSSSQLLVTESPPMPIQGIANDRDNLYIIRRGEKGVLVYTLADPSKLPQQIETNDLEDLRDIAANTRFLFITDAGHNCVWKITLRLEKKFTKIIQDVCDPYTISINSREEILMAQNPNKLLIYNSDGSEIQHLLSIPGIECVFHAFQASSDTIAMSVILASENGKTHGIILVSSKSPDRYFKKYTGGVFGALYQPYHIATNEEGSIYVADHGNERILILDKDLKTVKSVSFSSPYIRPTRLHYTGQRLIVGQNNGVVRLLGSTYLQMLERVSQLKASSEENDINGSEERDQPIPSII